MAPRRKRQLTPEDNLTGSQRSYAMLARSFELTTLTGSDQIGFTPTPGPQEQFINTDAFEVLFGGAAGGASQQP